MAPILQGGEAGGGLLERQARCGEGACACEPKAHSTHRAGERIRLEMSPLVEGGWCPEPTAGTLAAPVATGTISVSLEEALLADLDAHSANRSAAVREAISLWLQNRRVAALQQAYADLSKLQAGDLNEAHRDALTMGAAALNQLDG